MIAAIMQPYFFPYIGYFQLMRAVDLFVFYDDVQYIDRGWVNRNRILVNDQPAWLTLPVRKASRTLAINQRSYLAEGVEPIKQKLRAAYSKAPAFDAVFPFVCELLDFEEANVAAFNQNLLSAVAGRLNIQCEFSVSSRIEKPPELRGEAKIMDLCKRLGVDQYVNAIGGIDLYDARHFDAAGVGLSFLRTAIPAHQPQQYLSIIHQLMTGGFEATRALLDGYEILDPVATADARARENAQASEMSAVIR